MPLRFSDGMEFDTTGPLHAEFRSDGWYVVGEGMLIPARSAKEANELVSKLKKEKVSNGNDLSP